MKKSKYLESFSKALSKGVLYYREPQAGEMRYRELKGMGFGGQAEEEVGETERRLRYQIRHMIVCSEGMHYIASSRVAPQEIYSCPSNELGQEFF